MNTVVIPLRTLPTQHEKAAREPFWLLSLRAILLLILIVMPAVIVLVPFGRQLFWTVMIAVLPLFFTAAGFHFWRRICPLALFGQLGRLVGRPGKRRAGPWLAKNYLLVQLGILVFALSLRLVATNGSPWALAGFLVALMVVAAATSFLYTGKTWCNHFCPVSVVEKLYTEPVRVAGSRNSQCASCSACKKNCPDIDAEAGYWKEISLPARRLVYFAWPGIVLGFYAYFHAVSGGWNYYFSGDWTRETGQLGLLLAPGFTFAPQIPRVLAAPLMLVLAGALSYGLFALVERFMDQSMADPVRLRHRLFALAGFCGFLLFYFFAGQPTLLQTPWIAQRGVETLVVFVAAMILFKRWPRREEDHVRDKLGRRLRAQPEACYEAYRDTVQDLIADGELSARDLAILDRARRGLGIGDKEHDKIVLELASQGQRSQEERLQRRQYAHALERLVLEAAEQGHGVDEKTLERLREDFSIPADEHMQTLALLGKAESPVTLKLRESVTACVRLRHAIRRARSLQGSPDDSAFFEYVAIWRLGHHQEQARALLVVVPDPELSAMLESAPAPDAQADAEALMEAAQDASPYLRAAAVELLRGVDDARAQTLVAAAANDPALIVRQCATGQADAPGLFWIEKMRMLHKVPLFAALEPDDLDPVTQLAQERHYPEGALLCREGELSEEVCVIISGSVRVCVQLGSAVREIARLKEGDCVGEMAALDHAPRSATVITATTTHVLVIEGEGFRALLAGRPAIAQALLGVLSARLRMAIGRSGSSS